MWDVPTSLLSLVANTGLGLVSQTHKPVSRYNGTGMIYVSLGSVMEPLSICTTTTTTTTATTTTTTSSSSSSFNNLKKAVFFS